MRRIVQKSISDDIVDEVGALWKEFKAPVVSAVVAATIAYMFVLTNKIVNWDDMQFLFGKGYTVSSGRWGLELIELLLPSYSMPWLWGVLSIGLIVVSICLIIRIFGIQNTLLQCALSAAVMVFPSQIGTFLYMFTSSAYAVAFLLAVLSVYLYTRGGKRNIVYALLAIVFACSIYQAYVAVSASFFVLLLIQKILQNKYSFEKIIKTGCLYLLFLAVSMAVYYGTMLLTLWLSGNELNAWAIRATTDENGIIYRAFRAWKLFAAMIVYRTYGLITTNSSWAAHIIGAGVTILTAFWLVVRRKNVGMLLLFVLLVGCLLPLSVNCLVLLLGENGVHALTLYSFISVYILAVIVMEQVAEVRLKRICTDVVTISLAVIIASNVYAANKAYLKQYLVYENTFAFYETIITQIQMTEGFDENSKIAVLGNISQDSSYLEEFGEDTIYGLCGFKGEAISDDFITYYLGVDLNYATTEEKHMLCNDERVVQMKTYPYYGYVQKIDEYIVVKIGE